MYLLLHLSVCASVHPSLYSIIPSLPLESLYLSHSLSLGVSQHSSVFPQCLVTVADFVSIQWLIGKSYALFVPVLVCMSVCGNMLVRLRMHVC